MAITNNGVKNSLIATQKPSGYTSPTVTTFTDYEYKRSLTLSVLKSTVEAATPALTMTAIFDNATVGLNKQINDIVAADYLGTATVTSWANLVGLTTNVADVSSGEGEWLDNTPVSYIATVVLYVKAL